MFIGDRYITVKELQQVMDKLGFAPTVNELRLFMEEADADSKEFLVTPSTSELIFQGLCAQLVLNSSELPGSL